MSAQKGIFGRSWVHTVPNSTIKPSWMDRHKKRDVGDSAQVIGAMIFTNSEYRSRIILGPNHKNDNDTVLVS